MLPLISTGAVLAEETPICRYTGSVNIGGTEAPGGTRITAEINGIEYHTHTPIDYNTSTYSITIKPPRGKSYTDGSVVTFKVNGYRVDQESAFIAESNVGLDLTADVSNHPVYERTDQLSSYGSSSADDGSFNWPFFTILIFLLLAAGFLTYYAAVMRRLMIRTRAKNKKLL
jgi:hypothetical protein